MGLDELTHGMKSYKKAAQTQEMRDLVPPTVGSLECIWMESEFPHLENGQRQAASNLS